jgi:hypothetical protein
MLISAAVFFMLLSAGYSLAGNVKDSAMHFLMAIALIIVIVVVRKGKWR